MTAEMDKEDGEEISTIISNMPALRRFNRSSLKHKKSRSLVLNYVNKCFTAKRLVLTGSAEEGIWCLDSDFDIMVILDIPKIHTTSTTVKGSSDDMVVFLEPSEINPGYARLRFLHCNGRSIRIGPVLVQPVELFTGLCEINEYGRFLSSEKFASLFTTESYEQHAFPDSVGKQNSFFRNGPCSTVEVIYAMGKPGVKLSTDLAHAIECDSWPADIKEDWLFHSNKHRWPSRDLVEKVAYTKCLVVPVCQKGSDILYEWRISFVEGELELIWSLNDIQIRVMFILKRLFKRYVQPVAPDDLSSYIIKTVLFWVSAETGLSLWVPKNLLFCIEKCLNFLSECVQKRHLLHFINQKVNLLRNKLKSNSKHVVDVLNQMKSNILYLVLKECADSRWVHIWEETHDAKALIKLNRAIRDLTVREIEQESYIVSDFYVTLILVFERIILLLSGTHSEFVHTLESILELDTKAYDIPGADAKLIDFFRYFLQLKMGWLLMQYVPKKGLKHLTDLRTGKKLPSINVNCFTDALYLSSAYFHMGHYSKVIEVIENLWKEADFAIYLPRFDVCHAYWHYFLREGPFSCVSGGPYFSFKGIDQWPMTFNIIFSKSDSNVVPYPLKFECATVDDYGINQQVSINPFVYANFLLCQSYNKLGNHERFKRSLAMLQETVDLHSKPTWIVAEQGILMLQRFRMWNLLAYCYVLKHDYRKALKYYGQSIGETESISAAAAAAAAAALTTTKRKTIVNAAYWQITLLAYKRFQARSRK